MAWAWLLRTVSCCSRVCRSATAPRPCCSCCVWLPMSAPRCVYSLLHVGRGVFKGLRNPAHLLAAAGARALGASPAAGAGWDLA